MKKLISTGLLSLFAVTVSVPAIGQSDADSNRTDQQESTSEQQAPAIQVGDASISKKKFNRRLDQRVKRRKMRQKMMKKKMQSKKGGGKTPQMPDVDREKIKEQLKEQTIKQLVLEHHASKAGISVTESELQEQWQKMVDRFGSEEKLTQRLEQSGKDKSALMNDIKKYLRIKKFVDQKAENSEVTDQEVRDFYDKNKKRMGDKSFDEAKEQIRKMLKQQKLRETRSELVEKLRKKTNVDVNI